MNKHDELVLIVGGGITGLISAIVAQKSGKQAILIESSSAVGGLWSSRKIKLGGQEVELDNGLRLPVLSEDEKWDCEIFFNNKIDFEWINFSGWPREASAFNGKFVEQSSCVDARHLGAETLSGCIEQMVAARVAIEGETENEEKAWPNDRAFIEAHYGKGFADHVFEPILKGITGLPLSELAHGSCMTFVPRRLIMCDSDQIVSFNSKFPQLLSFVAHADHSSLPPQMVKKFIYPARGSIACWVEALHRHLIAIGVDVKLNTKITQISSAPDNAIAVELSSGEKYQAKSIIWSIPPVLLASQFKELGLTAMRPDFLNLSIHHLKVDMASSNVWPQYMLNFEQNPAFFRSIFWDNITGKSDNIISFEVLHDNDYISASELKKLGTRAFEQLKDIGCLRRSAKIKDQVATNHCYSLPKITPEYKAFNERVISTTQKMYPGISFVGRAAGNTRFLQEIIEDVVKSVGR